MYPYISIDLETTGLDERRCQILEFAAVLWANDEPIVDQPTFHSIVRPKVEIVGEPYALTMNGIIIDYILDPDGFDPNGFQIHNPRWSKPPLSINKVLRQFREWVLTHFEGTSIQRFHPIGSNFSGFDLQFLKRLPTWCDDLTSHRCINTTFLRATRQGVGTTPVRHDIPGEPHEALYDARTQLENFRQYIYQKESNEST